MSRARNWCFTLNNYAETDITHLSQLSDEECRESNGVRYLVFQQEKGATGTPHLQGFVSLSVKKRLKFVKELVGDRSHVEVAKGSAEQNTTYCTKDSDRIAGTDPISYGKLPCKQGARNDLLDFKEAVKNGCLDRIKLREDFDKICARYPRYVNDYVLDHTPKPQVSEHSLYPWQQDLSDRLSVDPGDREIIFVVDKDGNAGKTWFAKRYCNLHETAQFMEPGKKADMAYSLCTTSTVLFVNVTRQQVERIQYSFLEACKDGLVFSPKYESGMKYLQPMHVVVLMNEEPDMTALSADRYTIINVLN